MNDEKELKNSEKNSEQPKQETNQSDEDLAKITEEALQKVEESSQEENWEEEFDLAAKLAEIEETETNTKQSGIKILKKSAITRRAQSALKVDVSEKREISRRWIRLTILLVLTIIAIIYLFYYDLERRKEPLKQAMKAAAKQPLSSIYPTLSNELEFWNCDLNSLHIEIVPAPSQMKESHLIKMSAMCHQKSAFGLEFYTTVSYAAPFDLPAPALNKKFYLDRRQNRFVSEDGLLLVQNLRGEFSVEKLADRASKEQNQQPTTEGQQPQSEGKTEQEGSQNNGDSAAGSESAPKAPKGD